MHNYTQLYTIIHSHTQLYVVIHNKTQLHTVIHNYTQLYPVIRRHTHTPTQTQLSQTAPGGLHHDATPLGTITYVWG